MIGQPNIYKNLLSASSDTRHEIKSEIGIGFDPMAQIVIDKAFTFRSNVRADFGFIVIRHEVLTVDGGVDGECPA
jgi:hypothetical protein